MPAPTPSGKVRRGYHALMAAHPWAFPPVPVLSLSVSRAQTLADPPSSLALENKRDRTVIDQFDPHVGAELAGLNREVGGLAEQVHEVREEAPGRLGVRG